jgi:hypothetical protein
MNLTLVEVLICSSSSSELSTSGLLKSEINYPCPEISMIGVEAIAVQAMIPNINNLMFINNI